MGLEELLSDLPTTSPAMKTQHTAQAAHSCLCACSLSGVRPGWGRGSLWQCWKDISVGLGSSGTGSEASVKRLRRATQFSPGPGLWAHLLLTPRSWVPQTGFSDVESLSLLSQGLVKPGNLVDGGPQDRWGLKRQLKSQPPCSHRIQSQRISRHTRKAPERWSGPPFIKELEV